MKLKLVLIFWFGCLSFASGQCLINSLSFETNDSDWKLINNNIGIANKVPAIVIPHLVVCNTYWWDSLSSGKWISCQNSGIHPTNGIGPNQSIKYRYTFKTCGEDSLRINMKFFRDNFCQIYLDNNIVFTEQHTNPNQSNLSIGSSIAVNLKTSGTLPIEHYLDFEIVEYNVAYSLNGWGGKFNGTISSIKGLNTIILNTPACQTYSCCSSGLFMITGNTKLCLGQSTSLTASGNGSVIWKNLNSNQITNGSVLNITPQFSTQYSVTSTDQIGCVQTQLVSVIVDSIPKIEITKSNDVSCQNPTTTLVATGGQNYSWGPEQTLNNSLLSTVIARPQSTTIYTVVAAIGNCTNTSTIVVNVDIDFKNSIEVPNAFSPNNDGNNDCLKLPVNAIFKSFKLKIFDRWGSLVYTTENPLFCWPGVHKGQNISEGTYFYYLLAETECKTINQKGDIILLR